MPQCDACNSRVEFASVRSSQPAGSSRKNWRRAARIASPCALRVASLRLGATGSRDRCLKTRRNCWFNRRNNRIVRALVRTSNLIDVFHVEPFLGPDLGERVMLEHVATIVQLQSMKAEPAWRLIRGSHRFPVKNGVFVSSSCADLAFEVGIDRYLWIVKHLPRSSIRGQLIDEIMVKRIGETGVGELRTHWSTITRAGPSPRAFRSELLRVGLEKECSRSVAEIAPGGENITQQNADNGSQAAGWMSPRELAKKHGVQQSPLERRLSRFRAKNHDGVSEISNRRPNKAQFLYDEKAVMYLIEELKKRGANGERKKTLARSGPRKFRRGPLPAAGGQRGLTTSQMPPSLFSQGWQSRSFPNCRSPSSGDA